MLYKELIPFIETKLKAGGIHPDDVSAETRIIAADMGNVTVSAAAISPDTEISSARLAAVNKTVNARIFDRVPLQYLVPFWDWYGIKLKLTTGVLCPRQETELIVDIALDYCKENALTAPVIADLCSGSGNIAIALKKNLPQGKVYAVENSALAVPTLLFNCKHNDTDVSFVQGSVLEKATLLKFRDDYGSPIGLDVIVSNPPYLTKAEMNTLQPELVHEPDVALYGGMDGLDYYRVMIPLWKTLLKKGGLMLFEIGENQGREVRKFFRESGFEDMKIHKDYGGNDRAVSGIKD
jgi:release factor glutamine methyltransferase